MAWSLVLSHLFVHSSRIFIHILTALSHLWRNKNKKVVMLRFRKLKLTMHSFNSTNIRYHDFLIDNQVDLSANNLYLLFFRKRRCWWWLSLIWEFIATLAVRMMLPYNDKVNKISCIVFVYHEYESLLSNLLSWKHHVIIIAHAMSM
jgi:hypothetical protein